MWLRSIPPLLIVTACAGGSPSLSPSPPAEPSVLVAPEAPAVSIAAGDNETASVHSLDERVVLWVDQLSQERGERGLLAVEPGGDLETRLRHARARAVLGHTVEAEQSFRAILTANPGCVAAQLGLARVLMSYGRYSPAAELLQAVRQLEADGQAPCSADTGWMLGACLLAADDREAAERVLRTELATGPGFGSAALVLANDYAGREAQIDALAILDAARVRAPWRKDLFDARVRMLCDLWLHEQAIVELRVWLGRNPGDVQQREALVRSLRAVGDPSAALSELGRLVLPAGEGVAARQVELGRLADEIELERRGGPRRYSATELLAVLRGGRTAGLRRRAFEALVAAKETRSRAVFVAWQQDHVDLRVAVVKSCVPGTKGVTALLQDALRDKSALVRGAAAVRCGGLDKDAAIPLLTAALAVEDDPYTFRCVHEALQRHCGPVVYLPHAEEATALGRERTLEAWRQIWIR